MLAVALAVALSLEHKGTQRALEYREHKSKFVVFYMIQTFSMIQSLSHIHRLERFILSNYVSSLVATDLSPCPMSRSTITATFLVNHEETPG
ncbi:hypothetical protein F2Q68_00032796 [Brassica cretica]|uniref:Uncharacterized protein n=1 Tax=Brassica cretica TaxID=69181 RepID=A0A8S9GBK6_BRACR|nr:hypothetical protein F2Q68_00032796 [Brassica cretica]